MQITTGGLNKTLGDSRTFAWMGTKAELIGGDASGDKSQEEKKGSERHESGPGFRIQNKGTRDLQAIQTNWKMAHRE